MNRATIYGGLNALFVLSVGIGALSDLGNAHPLFLIPLFALCTAPILYMRKLNDRYAVLAVFSALYFLWFGNLDYLHLMFPDAADSTQSASSGSAIVDPAEAMILLGGVLMHVGYLAACRTADARARRVAKEFPESALVVVSMAIWIVSTIFTWRYKVEILADASVASIARGLASITSLEADSYMLANYLQPASVMMIAYCFCRYKRPYMIPLLLAAVAAQFALGFIDDGKGEAMSGVMIVGVTRYLVDGKLPKSWIIALVAFVAIAFPVLQANRMIRHESNLTHAAAAEEFTKILTEAFEERRQTESGHNRAQNVFERVSLKDAVERIATRTGVETPFRHGETLELLWTWFIPRAIWPTKPVIQVGLLVAQDFYPDASSDVNLPASQLGELYWNFGWLGVLIGMTIIGAILGSVGVRCDLSEEVTLTRVLVLAVSIQVIVVGFESGIATQYSTWLRMMLAIWVLHGLFARSAAATHATEKSVADEPVSAMLPRFPNILG